MNNQTLKLNANLMEALQNHYANSDFSLELHKYLRGCDEYQRYNIKYKIFDILRTWSPVFDRDHELYLEDNTAFWIDICHVQNRILTVLDECGFSYPVYPENSPF